MAWIKRNLFWVVGGVIALALLGGAGFYIWQGWSHNSSALDNLSSVVSQLNALNQKNPAPGNDKINNTEIAREQGRQLQEWSSNATAFFQPIPAIPPGATVDGPAFSTALQKTIEQLTHEADGSQVLLPHPYEFSFTSEKGKMTFAPAGLNALAAQLGEVKTICEILFAAKINAIDTIKRARVSDDDVNGGAAEDYTDQLPVTNEVAVITPYVVTFRCFTPELARVMEGFATSSNAFVVKSVNVQRADNSASGPVAGNPVNPMNPMNPNYPPGMPGMPPPAVAPPPAAGKGGLPTILKEQQLRVTIEVDLVKLLPKA